MGITEYYSDDIKYFATKYLDGAHVEAFVENVNKNRDVYQLSDVLRKKIEKFHSKDVEMYKKALLMRDERIK